jgi:CubicO group peptidase (beta-lactamase class C family)
MPLHTDTAAGLDRAVARAQAAGRVPSLVAGVVQGGELVAVTGAGELPPPDPDTQYRIGSITKMLTAALVMRLRDEGTWSLDDPLGRYLPVPGASRASLRHLLSHTAGLRREPAGEWWERVRVPELERFLETLPGDLAVGEPSRSHHYSNLAYGLLGAALTRVTGTAYPDLLAKTVLEPLGMARTTYHPREPFARGYVVHPWHGTLREEPRHDSGAMAPAGQLWSTVADLARWAAFLADPVPAVLAPATVAQMCAPVVIGDPDGWTAGHGLGPQVWRRGERVFVGHGGSMPGYLAQLAVHRPSRTGVVAFANAYTLHGTTIAALATDLLEIVLDATSEPVTAWRPGAAPPPEVEALTGRWWWMGREFEAAWQADARELEMRPVDDRRAVPWRFTPAGTDRWRCRSGSNDGETMLVRRSRSGSVTALDIATFVFTRDPWPAL